MSLLDSNANPNQIGSGSVTIPTDALSTSATVTLSTAASAELTAAVHASIA